MRKILLLFAAALIGLSAMAKDYSVYICGRQLTDANKANILGDGTCSAYLSGPSSDTLHIVMNNVDVMSQAAWMAENPDFIQCRYRSSDGIRAVVVEVCGVNHIGLDHYLAYYPYSEERQPAFFNTFCNVVDANIDLIFEGNGVVMALAKSSVIHTVGNLTLKSGHHSLVSERNYAIDLSAAGTKLVIGDFYSADLFSAPNLSAIYYGGDYKYLLMEEAADKSCTQHPFCYYYRYCDHYTDDGPVRYERHRLRDHNVYYTYEAAQANILGNYYYDYKPKRYITRGTQIQGNSLVFLNGYRLSWKTLWEMFREGGYKDYLYWGVSTQRLLVRQSTNVGKMAFGNDCASINLQENDLHFTGDLTFYRDLVVYGTGTLTIDGNLKCTGTDAHCTSSKISLPEGAKLVVNGECNLRNTDICLADKSAMTVNSGVLTGVKSITVGDEPMEQLKGGLLLSNGEIITSSGFSAKGQTIYIEPAQRYALSIGNTCVTEANYTMLSSLPGVTVANGGYLRYNPATKTLRMKDVELSKSLYLREDITMEILGTNKMNCISLSGAACNLTIVGQESNQQSQINIKEKIILSNGGRVTFNNLSGKCAVVHSGSNAANYASVSVQACTMTFGNNTMLYGGINSFQWTDCYITPSTAVFSSTDQKFVRTDGGSVSEVKFTMHDGSKAPLAIEAFITGIDVDLMGTASPDGYTIPFDDHCTTVRLTEPRVYRVRTTCRVSGNGSTGATVRLAGEDGSISASYLSALEYEKSVVKYTPSSKPTTYTASAMAIGTSAPYDTVRSQPLRVEIPGEITAFGPLECKVADGLWIYVEEGERLDLLVYEGDTIWARVVDDCYPSISLTGAVKEDGVYHTDGHHFSNITALREKYDVLIWGDVAMTNRLQKQSVKCGDVIGSFSSDPSNKSDDDPFLGWALDGTVMPFYTRDEIKAMVVTSPLNINAVFLSDLANAGEDDPNTAIDEIYMRNEQLKTEKIISNGHVYIIVDNVIYDITGQRVE